ncbi:MAG TPA: globin domain-containing protein [Beijerinckiaceae bacterium]|jgi:nitric oxide dioxygenase
MTPSDIQDIRDTFRRLAGDPDGLAAEFYARLFFLDPSLKPMFPADLKPQGRKLVAMLAIVVQHLDRLDAILDDVRGLAHRHVGYGVRATHYATVGAALIATLESRLGDRFDAPARAAWMAAYTILSRAMIAAAEAHGTPARTAA